MNTLRAEWVLGDSFRSKVPVNDALIAAVGHGNHTFGLPRVITNIVVDYLQSYPGFGEQEWTTLCGRVAPAPPLPSDILAIWESPCPIFPDKKISDTHILVYIPTTVNDRPLTLKSLGEIARHYFPQNLQGYEYIRPECVAEHSDRPIDKAYWVLITKDVLPNSRNKSYNYQKNMVSALAKKSLAPYQVPHMIEAAVCIWTYYFSSRRYLFVRDPLTYTHCQENINENQMVVGAFDTFGLCIYGNSNHYYGLQCVGMAALRPFLNEP